MTTKNLLDNIKEFKKIRIVSWIGNITGLFFVVLIIYFFNRSMGLKITKAYLMTNAMGYVLYLIISKAKMLKRYIADIEPIISKEIEPWLTEKNISFSSLRKQRKYLRYITTIPGITYFIAYFYSSLYPFLYLREIFALSVIIVIFLVGVLKLISFRDFMNELFRIYLSISQKAGKEVNKTEFMIYDFKKIVIEAFVSGAVYFFIVYLLLTNTKIIHLLLFTSSFCVLFILGKTLYDAYKGFYKSLEQIDNLRSKIELSDRHSVD